MEHDGEIELAEAHLKIAEEALKSAQTAEREAEEQIEEALDELREASHAKDSNCLEVEVATTAGFYPEDHVARVSSHEVVEVQLRKAADFLKLTDTTGWVASVKNRHINTNLSYADNHLAGKIVINWGPSHGGGGA